MLFVVEVQVGELLAGGGERPEVRGERDAREFALQVVGVLGPVARVVEQAVDVVEDVPLRDLLVVVMMLKPEECRKRNVFPSRAVLAVVCEDPARDRLDPVGDHHQPLIQGRSAQIERKGA